MNFYERIEKFRKSRMGRLLNNRLFSVAAALVVFTTTYMLILPAITESTGIYCGQEEHIHDESCYTEEATLTCEIAESEGHTHSEDCYITVSELTCGLEESAGHTHGDGCYEVRTTLTCTNEDEDHVHDESCYTTETVLTCQLAESEGHTHTDACYSESRELSCGLEESEGHTHTDACYSKEEVLTCTEEEHEHTASCYSNPNADLESEESWTNTFKNVELTGKWSDDVIAIAETQIGYEESTRNYIVNEDGDKKGYTRYGSWYGNPYGDWCAMFAAFCQHYAEVDSDLMPYSASCETWIQMLSGNYGSTDSEKAKYSQYDLYHDYNEVFDGTYTIKPGDLVFFNWDSEDDADHVGIIYKLITEEDADGNEKVTGFTTIEGNCSDAVKTKDYDLDYSKIKGYGELPENPDYEEPENEVEEAESLEGTEEPEITETETEEAGSEALEAETENTEVEIEESETEEIGTEGSEAESLEAGSDSMEADGEEVGSEGESQEAEAIEDQGSEIENDDSEETSSEQLENAAADENAEDDLIDKRGDDSEELLAEEEVNSEETTEEEVTERVSGGGSLIQRGTASEEETPERTSEENTTSEDIEEAATEQAANEAFIEEAESEDESVDETLEAVDGKESTEEFSEDSTEELSADEESTEESTEEESTEESTEEPTEDTAEETEGEPFELTVELEDGTSITVSGTSDALPYDPAEITLEASRLEEEEADVIIADALAENVENENGETAEDLGLADKQTILFDIKLLVEGEEIEPIGPITVTFANIPEFEEGNSLEGADDISIIHVDTETQIVETMESTVEEDGSISMETDHFSIYAVAATSSAINATTISRSSYFTTNNVNGKTIKLGADITTANQITISSNTTIDLNGHTITYTGTSSLFNVTGGTLTIQDSAAQTYTETEVSGTAYGNTASYSSTGGLTYYVTDPVVTNASLGETTDTLYKYTITKAGMIIGSANGGRAITQSGGTVNLAGGYITNFDISSNTGEYGAAISTTGGTLNITGAVIAGNTAYEGGGGVYVNGATLNLSDKGIISGNTATKDNHWTEGGSYGGGGIYSVSSTVNISGGYLTNNSFNGTYYFNGGGGILIKGGSLNISGSAKLTGNYSGSGGGAVKTCRGTTTTVTMSGGYISSNHANGAEGGGVNIDNNGVGYFKASTAGYITNNSLGEMEHWGGGGLFCSDGAQMYVEDVLITENTADGYGGGVAGCSTGRVYIVVEDGGAIYDNDANGIHLSGTSSAKSDDRDYAEKNAVFKNNGYQDYYCALSSTVDGGMLGGGTARWTGSADGVAITSTSRNDVLTATYIMGLTANPSDADKSSAQSVAKIYINGNYSYTHGGGILANGYLLIGNPDAIVVPARIELNATKAYVNQSGEVQDMTDHIFTFNLTNENGEVVAIGTNAGTDSNGNTVGTTTITFDRRLPFDEAGTFTYYLKEVSDSNESNNGIIYDTSIYRITVTTTESSLSNLTNADGETVRRSRIYLGNVKIEKKNGDTGSYETIYDQDPGDDETHPVSLNVSGSDTTFTNLDVDTTSYTVKKEWSGDTPSNTSVTVHLMQNGTVYKTATLSSSNSWTTTWSDLPTRDSDGNGYSYSVQEESVSGYLASYSYSSSSTKDSYWVPMANTESLVVGQSYAIISRSHDKVLDISSSHKDSVLDSSDVKSISPGGSITINGTTYARYLNYSDLAATSTWTATTYDGKVVFQNNGYSDYVFLGCESDSRLKTTHNGSASCAQYAAEVAAAQYGSNDTARLYVRQGHVTSTSTTWWWAYYSSTNKYFGVEDSSGGSCAEIWKLVSSYSGAATVCTITNTPVTEIDFTVNIRKVAESNTAMALKDAKFNLLDTDGNTLKFTQGSDGYYVPDDNGSEELLISNANGYIRIKQLKGGTYTLKEVTAPSGYGLAADQTITLDENTDGEILNVTVEDPDVYYSLPKTGGMGTTPLTLAGILLMAGAGLILLLRNKGTTRRL